MVNVRWKNSKSQTFDLNSPTAKQSRKDRESGPAAIAFWALIAVGGYWTHFSFGHKDWQARWGKCACKERWSLRKISGWLPSCLIERPSSFFFFGQNKWGFWWGSAGASETLKYRDGKCWRERGVALFFLGSSEVEMFLTRSKSNLHLKPNRKQYHTLPHSRDDLRVRCLRKVSASFGGGKAETRTQTHPTTNRCRGQILW